MASAEQVVNCLSLRIAMQEAIAETLSPLLQDAFDDLTTRLDKLNDRVTRLEREGNVNG
jgi:hypothetical protein